MQWKMAARSRVTALLHAGGLRLAFSVLLALAPRLPRWLLHALARPAILAAMAIYPQSRTVVEGNLARVLGQPPGSPAVRRARRRLHVNLARYWVDLAHFAPQPPEKSRRLVRSIYGLQHLRRPLAAGRGVLLITAHLGNWELGGVLMREMGVPVSVVYVPDESPATEAARARLRGLVGVEEIPIHPGDELSSLPVLRALRQGKVVALQGDRDFNDRGWPVEFFGAPAPFPPGPMILASLTGSAVVPVFIVYDERLDVRIEFGEPIEVASDGDRRSGVHRALSRWVAVLEAAVRRWPEQWYTYYDFWDQPGATGGEGGGATRQAAGEAAGAGGASGEPTASTEAPATVTGPGPAEPRPTTPGPRGGEELATAAGPSGEPSPPAARKERR